MAAATVAVVADVAAYSLLIRSGVRAEANALVRWLGFDTAVWIKMTALVVLLMLAAEGRHRRFYGIALAAVAVSGIVGYVSTVGVG